MKKLNYAGRVYDEKEKEALHRAADEFWLTHGHFCDEFQDRLRSYIGVSTCLVVNSGSSANLLAFMALTSPKLKERRIKRGDEVITTACCFPTTVAPIVSFGATPVFVDITLPSCNADVEQIKEAITPKTKAIVLAHTLGNPFDISRIKGLCEDYGLWLIEDACDALGGTYKGQKIGSFGDIGTFSFFPAHQITTGEGGAVVTSDPLLAKIMTSMRDWGRDCTCNTGQDNSCGKRFSGQFGSLPEGYDHKYVYSEWGYNLKMTEMQGAIGTVQMDKLPSFVEARRRNWLSLRTQLDDLQEIFYMPEPHPYSEPCWFGFMLLGRRHIDRRSIQTFLEDRGIQTRLLFAGNILRQPIILEDYKEFDLRCTDKVMRDGLWVGAYPGLSTEDIDYMAETIRRYVNEGVTNRS